MKTIKKIISVILVAMTVLSFSACKSSGKVFDYNLDEYIKLAPYDACVIDKNSVDYKMAVDYTNYSNLQEIGYEFQTEELESGVVAPLDTANIDYIGKKDGVAFDGGTAAGQGLTIGSSSFIEGFESGLVGKKIGETVDLDLTFPENYHEESLAGAKVVFTVTINSVERPTMPEITADLAKKLGYNSAEEYKEKIQSSYLLEYVWNKAVSGAEVIKYPEKEVNEYIEDSMADLRKEAEQNGTTLQNYLNANGLTEELYREYLMDYAKSFTMQRMIFYSIARKENIVVSDEEVDATVKEVYGEEKISSDGRNWVYESLLQKKVSEFLLDKAKIS